MPLVQSTFSSPWWLPGGHLQTIVPVLLADNPSIPCQELIIETPDGDFLEADYYETEGDRLAIISHGLEGNSRTRYVLGMTKTLIDGGWNVLAWNFRACGSGMNRLLPMYHSGKSEDLGTVVDYSVRESGFKNLVLIGFSVGGNITLKYLGEKALALPPEIKAGAAISPPCDLGACSDKLAKRVNFIYMKEFLRTLREKIRQKSEQFPGTLNLSTLKRIRTFREFDDAYTAPLNGFSDAEDYYQKCSSIGLLEKIRVPTLILSAKNDPFLAEDCYPVSAATENTFLHLEMPESGGHVGFWSTSEEKDMWAYERIFRFFERTYALNENLLHLASNP